MNAVEMLDVLAVAIEDAERRRVRGKALAHEFFTPDGVVLGEHGKFLGPGPGGRGRYGFTLNQLRAMSETIRNAIREDAGLPPLRTDRRRR